ncbi:MAG: LPXTG cell wall anchor domain-containing protein [Acidimicrobiia bacterium]|nr:LPXTG cell wall anchor domain-containing protein [Acidimicrobiia bacterium]
MRRITSIVAMTAALFVIGASAAIAAEFEIPIDTVVRAPEGSITPLTTVETPEELVGAECQGVAEATNQDSVHPNNDLIISSAGTSVTLVDVERAPGVTTVAAGTITLGPTVSVALEMGEDEVFSGGLVIVIDTNCQIPTTTTPTEPPAPAIVIEKTANPERFGFDGIGGFTIEVTNPGPLDLFNIEVTDDVALAVDPSSNCPNDDIPDLKVGESYAYDCTIGNLDTSTLFTNVATVIGEGPNGTPVTDTDEATVLPPVLNTTITQAPTTTVAPTTTQATGETLPDTGPAEDLRNFAVIGLGLLLGGAAALGSAAYIGRMREER